MIERMRELEAREHVLKELLAQKPADIPDITRTCPASIGEGRAADGSAQHPPRIAMRRQKRSGRW
jgi:hypothetical protein